MGPAAPGARKKFEWLTLHAFEDDTGAARARTGGRRRADRSARGRRCFRLLDPQSGRPAVADPRRRETTLDAAAHANPPLPVDGTRCAPYRRNTPRVEPSRLSHIALATTSVPAQIDFCERVLGLRLSDRSGDGVAFIHAPHGGDHHLLAFAASPAPALHHLSWDVPTIEEVGLGYMQMAAAGYRNGWGVGRHVLGSNYFYYVQDPWGSFSEYSATMDYIPRRSTGLPPTTRPGRHVSLGPRPARHLRREPGRRRLTTRHPPSNHPSHQNTRSTT